MSALPHMSKTCGVWRRSRVLIQIAPMGPGLSRNYGFISKTPTAILLELPKQKVKKKETYSSVKGMNILKQNVAEPIAIKTAASPG